MNLFKVVEKYMTEVFTDPASTASIRGAVRPFAEVTNSGPASRRRILETAPATIMFPSYTVRVGGQIYVVGGKNVDFHHDTPIRNKYPILPSDAVMRVGTVAQAISGTTPTANVYGYLHYVKGSVIDSQDSKIVSNFSIYGSHSDITFARDKVVLCDGKYYKIRSTPYYDGSLFTVAESIELDSPLQTMALTRSTGYDPVADTILSGSTESMTVFVENAYFAYDHTSERYAELKPGDKTITIVSATRPKVGDTIGKFRILTIDDAADGSFVCHCRG